MTAEPPYTVTNLELRESMADGSAGAGLTHATEGLFLLHVKEVAVDGEPLGCATVLHDAGDHGGRYLRLAGLLAEAGWAVALPDLRGHGESEGERGHSWGIKEVVRDLDAIQDHLAYQQPTAPQVLIGQGLGATYALAYALAKPGRARALVLVAPLFDPRFDVPEPKRGGLFGLFGKRASATDAGHLGWGADALSPDVKVQAEWEADRLTHDRVTRGAAESISGAARDTLERAGDVDVPVLILQGADDPLAGPNKSRELARDGVTVEVLEGARHHPLSGDAMLEVGARIRDWLGTSVS